MRASIPEGIRLSDPVPWFTARTITANTIDLHVLAGRWVVLAFVAPEAAGGPNLPAIRDLAAHVAEDRLYVLVIAADPVRYEAIASATRKGFALVDDGDGAIARRYGASASPRTIVLDPMLRAVANIGWDDPNGHAAVLKHVVTTLPDVDGHAGVPLTAPVLIVPRIFEFELCDLLIDMYDEIGGADSGFLMSQNGQTATVVDHRLKRRQDMVIGNPELRAIMRDRIVRRLLPALERHMQFRATHMDRYLVSCYDAALGGHFYRHRDNLLPGSRHRRFAVSLNLNGDYDGCDVVFPEFGAGAYRAPVGGAVVFATSTLHQVQPITRGRRFVFVPFLYAEADVAIRLQDNQSLAADSHRYAGGDDDRLYPELVQKAS